MKKTKKIILSFIVIIIVLLIACIGYLHFSTYQPSNQAELASQVAIKSNKETIFKAKHNKLTVIVYPGALVSPEAYSIWAKKVAQNGYTVKIAHFPLNMAIFNVNAANNLINTKQQNYVIGGHSLGGAMAARYVHNTHNNHLKGIFFLGSYADKKGNLADRNISALSIVASRDGVLNWKKYNSNKKYLPKDTEYKVIKGGNHGNFGSYGLQKGDHKSTISNKQQQNMIANKLIKWLNTIKK